MQNHQKNQVFLKVALQVSSINFQLTYIIAPTHNGNFYDRLGCMKSIVFYVPAIRCCNAFRSRGNFPLPVGLIGLSADYLCHERLEKHLGPNSGGYLKKIFIQIFFKKCSLQFISDFPQILLQLNTQLFGKQFVNRERRVRSQKEQSVSKVYKK